MKTLYVSDLDGTLLNSDAVLTNESVRKINRLIDKGLLFTYATARSYSSANPLTKALKLNLPLATYNGAFLVEPKTGRILEMELIPEEELAVLCKTMEAEGFFPLVYAVIDGVERVSWITGKESIGVERYLTLRKSSKRLRPVETFSQLFAGSVFYITLIDTTNRFDMLVSMAEQMHLYHHLQIDIYHTDEYWLEIFSSRASKANAVKKLKAYTGADQVISFGDNVNDIPMFHASSECYAVENASQSLKDVSTGLIQSNNRDAVALWLESNANMF